MKGERISRRRFVDRTVKTAATFASISVVPSRVLAATGQAPPSEIINQAIIGVGGMGMGHVDYVLNDSRSRLVAVCDVDEQHLANGLKKAGDGCKGYRDFREVLDRGDVDILHVVTPPHWHALISVAAAEAGCDIWCEKPMTRTIGECQPVVDAVQRNGRMFRLNTWFRLYGDFYGLGTTVKPLKKLVASGLLGWPLTVRVSRFTGFDWKVKMWEGRTNLVTEPVPPYFDYDMWLGPAPHKPYNPGRTHQVFRGYWDYDGGGLTDMGQHYLDPVQYFLGKDDTSPIEVEARAPWPVDTDAVGLWGQVELRYADGCRIILESGDWGTNETEGKPYIEGPRGKVYQGFKTDPPGLVEAVASLPDPEPMVSDFVESVKTRQKFGLNEMNGRRSNILVHMANAAIRTGRKLRFDPETLHFIGDDEANRLVDQPMRAPWRLTL